VARLQPALRVVVLEKSQKLLSKVKVSGGGRCNVTHACFDVPELVTRYPRGKNLLKKTFHRFGPQDTIAWFEQRGVQLKTEADGRMFPVTDQSQTIIDCLLAEAARYGVQVQTGFDVREIRPEARGFLIHSAGGTAVQARYVCVACGGFPKALQFDWLVQLGHTIEPPLPSLFTFNIPGHSITQLMGVSVPAATVKVAGTKLSETAALLITHWGLSGPAVLRLSAWGARELASRNYHFTITVNWLNRPEQDLRNQWPDIRRQHPAQQIGNRNPFGLPARLWEYLLQQCGIALTLRWADLPAAAQNKLIALLTAQPFEVKGKTTFKEEFVTCGGIRLPEIEAATLESRVVPGLYFAGEILDVDGITGGFNFQHAWTSGWIAAQAMANAAATV
jgi:predicted Rossmann fold flavoprotein